MEGIKPEQTNFTKSTVFRDCVFRCKSTLVSKQHIAFVSRGKKYAQQETNVKAGDKQDLNNRSYIPEYKYSS
jgi:hypothetical protein